MIIKLKGNSLMGISVWCGSVVVILLLFVANWTVADSDSDNKFSIVDRVKIGPDFKPLYKGKVIPRYKLNLTDLAKKVKLEPDYYEPGEGPEYDADEDDDEDYSSESLPSTTSTTTTTTTTTTKAPPTTTVASVSTEKPFSIVERVKIDKNFRPTFNGKVIPRHKLNLTDLAKRVKLEPDYYEPGEGPDEEDDDEDEVKSSESPTLSTTAPSTTTLSTTATTDSSTSKPFSIVERVKIDKNFKPLYNGKVIPRHKLNLTDLAKRVKLEPDYYEPGEGPDDDEEDEEIPDVVLSAPVASSTAVPSSSASTTTTKPSSIDSSTEFSIVERVKIGDDFKPLYNGKIIPRYKLNLTDLAKRVKLEPDYYDEGEGPEEYDDDEETEGKGDEKDDDDADANKKKIPETTSSTTSSSSGIASSSSTVSTEDPSSKHFDYEDNELSDVDMAVGGISGIVEKIMQGPKKNEINDNSTPEEVYLYLRNLIQSEFGKAMKATIPRIYDYQFPIGNMISQRCFNSFVQFGERFRSGYVWPAKMVAASASLSFTNFALRDYGDFDHCLDVVADDADRRHNEQFFTGQYCMMQLEVPLPAPKKNVNYLDKILQFNGTEMSGTFEEFLSLNTPFLYSNPLSMAICVPSTCMPNEIEDVIHYFLKKFHFKVKIGADCYSKSNLTVGALSEEVFELDVTEILQKSSQTQSLWITWRQMTRAQSMAVIYIISAILLVSIATVLELYRIGKYGLNSRISTERNRPKSFLSCFSLRYNLQQMLYSKDRYLYEMPLQRQFRSNAESSNDVEMLSSKQYSHNIVSAINTNTIDGLKVFALIWICLANFFLLGYQSQMLPSVANIRELILGLKDSGTFQIITQSWLSFEIFFLLSGFLLAYTALPNIARYDGRPNLFFFIIKRMLRFVPSIIFIMLAICFLPLWKNAGPLYNSGVEKILQPCRRFYVRNVFFIANLNNYEDTCLPYFWYIGVEFQLFILGIFVTIFAYNRRRHALKTFIVLILTGIIVPGYMAYVKKANILSPIFHNAILDEIPNIVKELNFSVGVHFSAYFVGLAIGYYARMSASFRVLVPQHVRYLLWILLPTLSLVSIYLPLWWPLKSTFKYNQEIVTLYFANYRILFIGTFAWIIYECIHSRAVLVRCLLSSSLFRICSQISFQIYLINLLVIWIYFFTRRHVINSGVFDAISVAICLFGLTVVLALISYFLFEAPCRSLFRYYMESPRLISMINPQIQTNGRCLKDSQMNSSASFGNELNLNPNFYFSPHYNMITNYSSRACSETASVSNLSVCNPSKDAQILWTNFQQQTNGNGAGSVVTGDGGASLSGDNSGIMLRPGTIATSASMIQLDQYAATANDSCGATGNGDNGDSHLQSNEPTKDSNNNANCVAHITPLTK